MTRVLHEVDPTLAFTLARYGPHQPFHLYGTPRSKCQPPFVLPAHIMIVKRPTLPEIPICEDCAPQIDARLEAMS